MAIQTCYLASIYHLKQYQRLFQRAKVALKQLDKIVPFEAIAFTGTSGAALAYPLSLALNKPLICIRKDSSHYESGSLEGKVDAKTCLIIDDFIDTGATMGKIISKLRRNSAVVPVAIFLYIPTASFRGRWWDTGKQKIPVVSPGKSNFSIAELRKRFSK